MVRQTLITERNTRSSTQQRPEQLGQGWMNKLLWHGQVKTHTQLEKLILGQASFRSMMGNSSTFCCFRMSQKILYKVTVVESRQGGSESRPESRPPLRQGTKTALRRNVWPRGGSVELFEAGKHGLADSLLVRGVIPNRFLLLPLHRLGAQTRSFAHFMRVP